MSGVVSGNEASGSSTDRTAGDAPDGGPVPSAPTQRGQSAAEGPPARRRRRPRPGAATATATEPTDGAARTGEDGAPAAAGRRRSGPGRRTLLGIVAALLVSALVLTAFWQLRSPSETELRESAVLAARTYATSLTTFGAATLDQDAERFRRAATEEFAAQYDETIEGLRPSVTAEQTVSTGTVVGAGVEELGDETATVLVAVNQQITAGGGQPRNEANRLRMGLVRQDGRWLVDSVERL